MFLKILKYSILIIFFSKQMLWGAIGELNAITDGLTTERQNYLYSSFAPLKASYTFLSFMANLSARDKTQKGPAAVSPSYCTLCVPTVRRQKQKVRSALYS